MFHEVHASNVELSRARKRVKRVDGQRGLCFSQRPVLPGERISLKVTGVSHGSNNKGIGLRYGYTVVDPMSDNTMLHPGRQEGVASEHGYWLKAIGETVVKRSSVLVFCVCNGGEVFYGRNDEEYGILFAGVRTDMPLWIVVDLCGSATSLEFVDASQQSKTAASDMTKAARAKFETRRNRLSRSTEALPNSAAEASSTEIQSRRTSRQTTRLFSSARQSSRQSETQENNPTTTTAQNEATDDRSQHSRRRPRSQRHSVVLDDRAASSDTSHDVSRSTTDLPSSVSQGPTTHRGPTQGRGTDDGGRTPARQSQDSLSAGSQDSHTAAPRAATAAVGSNNAVTRRYRTPAVNVPMTFSSTTGRNVVISDDRRTVSRRPGDFCNAYVFTHDPVLPGDELVLRITGTNVDYVGGLTVGLTACDPTQLATTALPDDADKLLDRPEYWVVRKNICSRPKVNDELAFLRTVSGELQYCKNGRKAGTLMHVDCGLPLWAVFDVYGTANKLECLGVVRPASSISVTERNTANLSRYSQHVDDWPVPMSAPVHAGRSQPISHGGVNTGAAPQSVTAASVPASGRVPSSLGVTASASDIVSYRVLPATSSMPAASSVMPTASSPTASSDLLFDQLLPSLPPPLIPVPDRYQPLLVDVDSRVPAGGSKTRLSSSAAHRKSGGDVNRPTSKRGECSVCMESEPNAALYPCGHMCMCYECAVSVQKLRGALCPICRQPIIDILRIFRT